MTDQPAERCGNPAPRVGGAIWVECALRPGHQGSHADDEGARWSWIETQPAEQPALARILADAEHHEECARLSTVPEGALSHSGIAVGLRIAAQHVRRDGEPGNRYAADIECAIGLNVGGGGAAGVHAARDAVLAVRDAELEAARRNAVGLVERLDAVRDWARKHLDADQQAILIGVLRRHEGEAPDA